MTPIPWGDGGPIKVTASSALSGGTSWLPPSPVNFANGVWRPTSYARLFCTQPWVAITVMRMLTWSVRVPLKVYRREGDGSRQRLTPADHMLARAVVHPWTGGARAELTMALLGPLLVHGNGLMGITRGEDSEGRETLRFEPLDWRYVAPVFTEADNPASPVAKWEVYGPHGDRRNSRSSLDVLHVHWWSPLGSIGVSPLEQLRTTIDLEAAAVEWIGGQLRQGSRPSGVIQASEEFLGLDPEERQRLLDQLRSDLRENYAGPENAGLVPVLPPGLKWETANHTTAVEAELVEQRRVNRNEVAAVYQIPPPMVGILDRATYSNVATLREMAYTDALAPPLILIEEQLNAQVVRGMLGLEDVYVEYDFAGILRGDRLREVQSLREAISSGLLTPNEGREMLNRPRADRAEADELWMPQNNLRPMGAPDGRRLRDVALASQQFSNSVARGLVAADEAREALGLEGPAPGAPEPTDKEGGADTST